VDHILVAVQDITRETEAEKARDLLAAEIEHRAKNILTVVKALISRVQANSASELRSDLLGRVEALSTVHSLLSAGPADQAGLMDIILKETEAYSSQIKVDSSPIALGFNAAQPIALIIHELITNSVKYGALSTNLGRISINWEIREALLELSWEESGGPPVRPPSTFGFGTTMVLGLCKQLQGKADFIWAETGLRVQVSVCIR
jgi:two-component sensor histidine kinase